MTTGDANRPDFRLIRCRLGRRVFQKCSLSRSRCPVPRPSLPVTPLPNPDRWKTRLPVQAGEFPPAEARRHVAGSIEPVGMSLPKIYSILDTRGLRCSACFRASLRRHGEVRRTRAQSDAPRSLSGREEGGDFSPRAGSAPTDADRPIRFGAGDGVRQSFANRGRALRVSGPGGRHVPRGQSPGDARARRFRASECAPRESVGEKRKET